MGKSLIIKGADFSGTSILKGFTELGYICLSNSNGELEGTPKGRYISSGVNVSSDIRMAITFKTTTQPYSVMLSGSRYSNPSLAQAWLQNNRVYVGFGAYGGNIATNEKFVDLNLWDGGEHTIEICRSWFKIDGVEYAWDHESNTGSWDAPIYLDCSSYSDSRYNSYVKVSPSAEEVNEGIMAYECIKLKNIKIWKDDAQGFSLLVDAIPVQRFSDKAVGFYNKVNGTYLLRNDGSTPLYGF